VIDSNVDFAVGVEQSMHLFYEMSFVEAGEPKIL